jgi:peptidoglycan/LPS O-acetylase OafA/YrhL
MIRPAIELVLWCAWLFSINQMTQLSENSDFLFILMSVLVGMAYFPFGVLLISGYKVIKEKSTYDILHGVSLGLALGLSVINMMGQVKIWPISYPGHLIIIFFLFGAGIYFVTKRTKKEMIMVSLRLALYIPIIWLSVVKTQKDKLEMVYQDYPEYLNAMYQYMDEPTQENQAIMLEEKKIATKNTD